MVYNLLVTAQKGAWDSNVYEYDRSRFLEYTTDELYHKFKNLTEENKKDLTAIPCIFAYERRLLIKIGYLKSIELKNSLIRIKYEFCNDIAEISFSSIESKLMELDIRDWEMNRTHWAVKNEPLFDHLSEVEEIPEKYKNENKAIKSIENKSDENKVGSVREFIDRVLSSRSNSDNEIFYRGHEDSSYRLVPSLFRSNEYGDYLHKDNEGLLYRELIISNPSDFVNDSYTIERLIRMQHYSYQHAS